MQRKLALLQQSDLHSKQFEQAQAQLMEARQAEEARGGVPGAGGRGWPVEAARGRRRSSHQHRVAGSCCVKS